MDTLTEVRPDVDETSSDVPTLTMRPELFALPDNFREISRVMEDMLLPRRRPLEATPTDIPTEEIISPPPVENIAPPPVEDIAPATVDTTPRPTNYVPNPLTGVDLTQLNLTMPPEPTTEPETPPAAEPPTVNRRSLFRLPFRRESASAANPAPAVEPAPAPTPQENTRRGISRRGFLAGALKIAGGAALASTAAGSAVGGVVGTYVASDPEVRLAAKAALERPKPKSVEDKFDQLTDEALDVTYERYFKGRENIMSKDAWVRKESEGPLGFGTRMGRIANLYYDQEKTDGESFDAYFIRFMDKMYKASQDADLDFIVFVSSMQVSSENIGYLAKYKNDVSPTGLIQTLGVSLARRFNKRYELQEAFASYGPVRNLLIPVLRTTPLGKDMEPPKEGWNINSVIRIPFELTTGMMDFEPSMRARALLQFGSPEARKIYAEKYPNVVLSYQKMLQRLGVDFEPIIGAKESSEETVVSSKKKLETVAQDYLAKYQSSLDRFATDAGLASIGIDPQNLDPWQKYNRTEVWLELNRRRDQDHPPIENQAIAESDPNKGFWKAMGWTMERKFYDPVKDERANDPLAVEAVRTTLKYDFENDRQRYYQKMMSQQVLNPRFTQVLINEARKAGRQNEVAALRQIQEKVRSYQGQADEYRQVILETVIHENPYEFNTDYQTLASTVTTKMLSASGGEFDPTKRDSVYWNVFRTVTNRELSQPLTLVSETGFAPDAMVDPVYALEPNLKFLDAFHTMLLQKGVITKPATEDVFSMDRAIQRLSRNDFSAYQNLNLTDEDKKILHDFARYHIMEMGDVGVNRAHQVLEIFSPN